MKEETENITKETFTNKKFYIILSGNIFLGLLIFLFLTTNLEWNNKKWRSLYIVDENFITNIKGYPYQHNEFDIEISFVYFVLFSVGVVPSVV